MIPVLTRKEAYKLDRNTIKSGHLSKRKLLDNAGKSIAQFFCENISNPFNQKVIILCGKGSNGEDGVIAHAYLKKYNVESKILFVDKNNIHQDLLNYYKVSKVDYKYIDYRKKINDYFSKDLWIIDAIFGIGLSRFIDCNYVSIISCINQYDKVISIDIPSGLFTDSNNTNYFVNAKYVVTFGYPKLGHYVNCINSLFVRQIGFIQLHFNNIMMVTKTDIHKIIKPFKKKKDIHKYNKGTVHIIAGSDMYPGAAALASLSAVKTGSGFVYLHTFDMDHICVKNMQMSLPEVVVVSNSKNPIKEFIDDSKGKYLIGPGITYKFDKSKTYDFVNSGHVFDSGSFEAFENIDAYKNNAILTPHKGEFEKIFKLEKNCVLDIKLFKSIQKKIVFKIIILKTFNTFIITNKNIYIIDIGPSILATAGSGDVLSGIIVSLLSQGYSRLDASLLGVYLHAESANYYMNNISNYGMTASKLIDCIPFAFENLTRT